MATDRTRTVRVTKDDFLADRQGKTFADVLGDATQPFDVILEFFQDENRQRRLEESELHHDRPPLAGVVRELEALPEIHRFLATVQPRRNTRFRQAIGVLVRIIMERLGWRKTGRKGSLGVRAEHGGDLPAHNMGGLAFWFVRAERYERSAGRGFPSVRERREALENPSSKKPSGKPGTRRPPRATRLDRPE